MSLKDYRKGVYWYSTDDGIEYTIRHDEEYKNKQKIFVDGLLSCYPHISARCASQIAESWLEFLQIAKASHVCPYKTLSGAISNYVRVNIEPHELNPAAAKGHFLAQLVLKTITISTTATNTDCPICMEKMMLPPASPGRTWMPCSHSFHRSCIIEWLNWSSVCPLCRYQIPPAKFRSISPLAR